MSFKRAPTEAQLLRMTGCFDFQRLEHLVVFGRYGRHARQWRRAVDGHPVMLDAFQRLQRPLRRDSGVGRTQTHAHHAVQDQRHEADRRMGPYALWQAVVDRANLQFRLQDLEAALNIGQ